MAPDTLLIKLPMGTGKTKALVEYLNRRELQTSLSDIPNERVTEGLEGAGLVYFDPGAADLPVVEQAEVLETLVDAQVNNWAELFIHVLDHFISKGLYFYVVFNMDARYNDVP